MVAASLTLPFFFHGLIVYSMDSKCMANSAKVAQMERHFFLFLDSQRNNDTNLRESNVIQNTRSKWIVFNNGQKMALRERFTVPGDIILYFIIRSHRHLLAGIENDQLIAYNRDVQ